MHLNGNGVSGSIPPELGSIESLKWLGLGWNGLTGPIPPELGNLANLAHLELSYNNLAGTIPPELGNLTMVERLALQRSHLTGSIPPELGNLGTWSRWTLWAMTSRALFRWNSGTSAALWSFASGTMNSPAPSREDLVPSPASNGLVSRRILLPVRSPRNSATSPA